MRLPAKSAAYAHHVAFGTYVARMLRTHGLTDLETSVRSATTNVQALGRAREDALLVIQEALADRDAQDLELDTIAQDARHMLASRSRDAVKTTPYTLIFPDTIKYYTRAPVAEEVARYTLLAERLKNNLPAGDAVCAEYLPRLEAVIATYEGAEKALESARNAELQAGDRLDSAEVSWSEQMEKTFGSLTEKYGREKAERFFP